MIFLMYGETGEIQKEWIKKIKKYRDDKISIVGVNSCLEKAMSHLYGYNQIGLDQSTKHMNLPYPVFVEGSGTVKDVLDDLTHLVYQDQFKKEEICIRNHKQIFSMSLSILIHGITPGSDIVEEAIDECVLTKNLPYIRIFFSNNHVNESGFKQNLIVIDPENRSRTYIEKMWRRIRESLNRQLGD